MPLRVLRLLSLALLICVFAPMLMAATVAELASQCQPSVLQILTDKGSGSGFVLSTGLVVTCFHVIADAEKAVVKTPDEITYPVAAVVAYDQARDVAILRVKKLDLPALPLADTAKVTNGEAVVTLGSPLGLEGTAVTDGVVSAVREYGKFGTVIQFSAPVSPGNSGGPMVNGAGQVLGIVSFGRVDGQNVNFAIPAATISAVQAAATQEYTFAELQKVLHGQAPDAKGPAGYGVCAPRMGAVSQRVPKKAPFTIAPFGLLAVEPDSINVSLAAKKKGEWEYTPLTRVTDEKDLQPGTFLYTTTGVLKFNKTEAKKDIALTFTYAPQRMAIWVPRDEERINLAERIEKIVRESGFETLRGVEVEATMQRLVNQGSADYQQFAKELNCDYLIACGYQSIKEAVGPWHVTNDLSLTMVNLASGSKLIDTSRHEEWEVARWQGTTNRSRQDLYGFVADILGGVLQPVSTREAEAEANAKE